MKFKLVDVKDRLPEAGKRWIEGLSSQERICTEIILNNVGIDSFLEHWKVHRDDLEYIRNFFSH